MRDVLNIERRLQRAGIPPRYHGVTFKSFTADTKAEIERKDWVEGWAHGWGHEDGSVSFAMVGLPGNGKTMLAAAIVRYLLEHGEGEDGICYTKARVMFREIKDTWSPLAEERESEVIGKYRKKKLLIIDEIEKSFSSAAERIITHELLDHRWDYRRPTIILGNLLGHDALEKLLGRAAMDRLMANGGRVLVFDGKSKRRE